MNNHLALHTAAKHLNKHTLRYIGFAAGAVAGCAAVISFLGTMLMLRQLQLVAAQKRALPVIQRAAQLYLDQNGQGDIPARRRKAFRFPRRQDSCFSLEVEPLEELDTEDTTEE
ncbi:MAG: hypothetical protein HFF14_01215 [Angelakisella sp.]|jgi:hypothetical protein|nr:hypothetical protein [Angelakisella sp.]